MGLYLYESAMARVMTDTPQSTFILTAEDAFAAAAVATVELVRKVEGSRTSDHGGKSDRGLHERWMHTFGGKLGERALSLFLDRAMSPGGKRVTAGDVGPKIESRHTVWQNGHLKIYTNDHDDSVFYLVVGEYPSLRVVGWIRGVDGKRKGHWDPEGHPPHWQIYQDDLHPWHVSPPIGEK